jgi:hypothetical protein
MSQFEEKVRDDAPSYGLPEGQDRELPKQEPARLGPLQRLVGVMFSPGETFEDVNRKPTWLAPLLIIFISTLAFSAFVEYRIRPDWDALFTRMVEKQKGKPIKDLDPKEQEQIKSQIEIQKKFAKTDLTTPPGVMISLAKIAIFCVIYFIIPAGIFVLGLMFMQAKTTFKKILSVVLWAGVATSLISYLVTAVSIMIRDPETMREFDSRAGIIPSNLAALLPEGASSVVSSIAGSIDIFTIWFLILVSIGFSYISGRKKYPTARTAKMVFGFWIIWVFIKAAFAAIGFGG